MKYTVLILFSLLSLNVIAESEDTSAFYTKDYQQKALEIYRQVISFETSVGKGLIPEMAKYLADEFEKGGFSKEDIHLLPMTSDKAEAIAALVVRYRGDGSSKKPPILLMAHMDVVAALAKDWQRSPFKLVEEDGYFFGRGTMDNKNGITMLTTTFLRLKAEGFVPSRDLIIAFSGDEETEQKSTDQLYSTYLDLTKAEFALNSDDGGGSLNHLKQPTSYSIGTSEKGYASFELTSHNPGGHSSAPRVDNAIYELADALKKLQAYRFPVRVNETTRKFFAMAAETEKGKLADAMKQFSYNPKNSKAADFLFTQPSFVGMTRTTCIATMLSGGHADNALPQSATAVVNCRIFPGDEFDDIKAQLQTAVGDNIEIKKYGPNTQATASALRYDVTQAVTKAVRSQHPGIPIIPTMVPWGTDGRHSRTAGIPTFGVTGLFLRGEDAFSHGLNERAPVRYFYQGLEYWYVILNELAGKKKIQ